VEALSVTPYARRALDRGTAALLVASVRHADDAYSRNSGAGVVDLDGPILAEITDDLLNRARRAGGERARDYLAERLARLRDEWAARRGGEYPLGYTARKEAQRIFVPLLDAADTGRWGDLTVARSMRETENEINLLVPGGDLAESPIGAPEWSFTAPADGDGGHDANR
jgi:hypothetical protein